MLKETKKKDKEEKTREIEIEEEEGVNSCQNTQSLEAKQVTCTKQMGEAL